MGAEGAAEIVFRSEIDAAEDKAARRKELVDEYRETFSNPYVAAGRRLVDDIIEPAETRRVPGAGAGIAARQARTASAEETWIDSACEARRDLRAR